MKTRILVNGNGQYKIQVKKFVFWKDLRGYSTGYPWVEFHDKYDVLTSNRREDIEYYLLRFKEKETAKKQQKEFTEKSSSWKVA